MTALVAILWTIYLSECFVRVRENDWVFRRGAGRRFRGALEPDAQFLDGRLTFSWTALLPWSAAYVVSGEELDTSSLKTAEARLELAKRGRRRLTAAATALFVLLLIAFPALALTRTLAPALPYLATSLALAWIATFTLFVASYRKVHGRPPALDTWMTQLLSPISLIRAPFVVSQRALADVHPVAAASVLCDDDEFLRIARAWHYDAADSRAAIERIVSARKLRDALTAPPASPDASAAAFCPRCHATYYAELRECRDCTDVPLHPLAARSGN
jgi:hypothetical protein